MQRSGKKPEPKRRYSIPDGVRNAVERRSGGRCEIEHPDCRGTATQMHHRLPRSAGGPHTVANLLHLCDIGHHVWVHGQPRQAREYGWLLRRGACPEATEVLLRPSCGVYASLVDPRGQTA
jgi:hypothetical protein